MKNLIYISFLIMIGTILPSCVENEAPEDAFGQGPNLVSFSNASMNLSAVATGDEYVMDIPMKIKGPSYRNISQSTTATISVDPSSTAVEGVHYRLEQTEVQISPDNNLLALFPITILTDGIEPPLAETPKLILNVANASGADNVIANGKKVTLNLLYLCDSQLQGNYVVSIHRSDNNQIYVFDDVITKTGDGQYRGTAVGHYAPGSLGGTPGFTFFDVCNTITVPTQNLVDLYSNEVYQDGDSYVDPITGNLHIEYTVTFAAGNRKYVADYVKQ